MSEHQYFIHEGKKYIFVKKADTKTEKAKLLEKLRKMNILRAMSTKIHFASGAKEYWQIYVRPHEVKTKNITLEEAFKIAKHLEEAK